MQYKTLVLSALASTAAAQSAQNLTAALAGNSNLTTLAGLIGAQPGLLSALSGASNITLLAPSNSALSALLNSSAGASLASNQAAVAALLQYHVLNGTFPASAVTNRSAFIPTLLNDPAYANVTGGQRVEALRVGSNVVFFSGLLANSTVTTANINFTGGVIHVINRVLTVPTRLNTTLIEADLRALYGALNTTGLLGAAGSLRDVTIFAPRNQAFQAIASGLGNLTTQQASAILQYHVVNGSSPYYSTRLANGTSLQTLNGGNVTIRTTSNGTFVNGARVLQPNVLVAGGVVHVIDQVLNPSNTTAASGTAATGNPAFSGLSSAGSDIPFTSGVTATRTATLGAGAAGATTAAGGAASSSTSAAGAVRTAGAVGAAALFGAAGAFAAAF